MTKLKAWAKDNLGLVFVAAVLAAFLFLVFLQDSSAADNPSYRISGGFDVAHSFGTPFVLGKAEAARFLYSQKTGFGVGAVYSVSRRGWDAGVGGVWLEKTSNINGTNLNFLLEAGYTWDRYSLRITHISNGKKLGIGPEDKPNDGWNLVTFGINF